MGVTRPSLYAAFGNKEALFRKALDLYGREKMAFMEQALAAPTARGVAERMLTQALAVQCGEGEGPRGCLHVISSVAGGPEAASIKAELAERRAATERLLFDRFERAREEGDLPPGAEPEALVRYLFTVMQGMAVQAGAGAQRSVLQEVVATTLALWPGR
jgi:AcrR family transcriptional regulator